MQEICELVLLRCPLQPTIEAYLRMRARGSSVTLTDLKLAFAKDPEGFLKSLDGTADPGTESSKPMDK